MLTKDFISELSNKCCNLDDEIIILLHTLDDKKFVLDCSKTIGYLYDNNLILCLGRKITNSGDVVDFDGILDKSVRRTLKQWLNFLGDLNLCQSIKLVKFFPTKFTIDNIRFGNVSLKFNADVKTIHIYEMAQDNLNIFNF